MPDGASGKLNFQRNEDGSVAYEPAAAPSPPDTDLGTNITPGIPEPTLDAISESLTESIAFDQESRSGWEEMQAESMDLLGLGPEADSDQTENYDGEDRSSHTLMLTAWLRFTSKAYSAMLPADDRAVRTAPILDAQNIEDPEQRRMAERENAEVEKRVADFYTEYLFKMLPSYEEDTDQILGDMGLTGLGIRKIVTDRSRRRTPVMPEYVPLENLTISYNARNFRVGRLAHRMDLETGDLIRRIRNGMYRPLDNIHDRSMPDIGILGTARDELYGLSPAAYQGTETHRIYEVYCDLFLENDKHPQGLPRPYIVTIHAETRKVLAIQRNWDMADPDETPLEHFVGYIYHPAKNSTMGVGLGQILHQITQSLRKVQRRGLEAGYLQNMPAGFKLSSLSIRDGETKVKPGEFIDVDSPTGDIREALMLHPFQGPSPGLLTMGEKLEANGRELGGIASIDFAQLMKSGVAAGPAMAAFEESTEFQTAVHRRLYKAHRKELEIVHDRMQSVIGNQTVLFGDNQQLQPGDLMKVRILPYMKPGQASRQRQVLEAQALWDLSLNSPDLFDRRQAAENMVAALGSPDAQRMLLPDQSEEKPTPADPVTEYMSVLAEKPISAGPMQNHQAHIDAHSAQLRMLGNSPLPVEKGEAAAAAIAAHIAEHMGLLMLAEVANRIGVPIEQFNPEIAPEIESQIAPLVAEAVAAIEAERRPPDPNDAKVMIEQIRQQSAAQREDQKSRTRLTEQELKVRHEREMALLKQNHERDMQQLKDAAAMDREVEDNTVAMRIAQLKGSGSANAGVRAGSRDG